MGRTIVIPLSHADVYKVDPGLDMNTSGFAGDYPFRRQAQGVPVWAPEVASRAHRKDPKIPTSPDSGTKVPVRVQI